MTIRLHIDRLVVDHSLAEGSDQSELGPLVEAELAQLIGEGPGRRPTQSTPQPDPPLPLAQHGTFAQRLARTLYDGVPALSPASSRNRT